MYHHTYFLDNFRCHSEWITGAPQCCQNEMFSSVFNSLRSLPIMTSSLLATWSPLSNLSSNKWTTWIYLTLSSQYDDFSWSKIPAHDIGLETHSVSFLVLVIGLTEKTAGYKRDSCKITSTINWKHLHVPESDVDFWLLWVITCILQPMVYSTCFKATVCKQYLQEKKVHFKASSNNGS